jgi:apolipoprotein N-acyltransferase
MISILIWVLVGAGAFHAAYASERTGFLIVAYLFALLQLARAESWRGAFYPGLGVGLLIAAIQLAFFWRIFSGGAIALWLVYAFWIGLFVALARLCLSEAPHAGEGIWRILNLRVGTVRFVPWLLIPFLWCGLEYFRSELYYLRFAWASPGFAFGSWPAWVPLRHVGTYGLGFLLMVLACAASVLRSRSPIQGLVLLVAGMGALRLWGLVSAAAPGRAPAATVRVAGVQMEFPTENEVLLRLEALLRQHPDTELVVLSEYTFGEPVPERIKKWCREHQRYLIVGGKDPAAGGNFYNTVYVISPAGEIVFRQVKSVPIQFFKDGLPAAEQKLWESPWGKIGLCICYDLSYSRVTDRLVKLGAQALIVPTMDVADWGERQHKLHARVAPVRAAEYGIPIFRLASSGISQAVDRKGRVTATAPCPGEGAVLFETIEMGKAGRLPLDRWLAPVAVGMTCAVMVVLALAAWRPGRPAGMSGEEQKGESVGWGCVSINRSPLTGLPPGPEGAPSTDIIPV